MKRLMLVGLAATLIACGSDDTSGPPQVTGTYTLSMADGLTLPATLYEDATTKLILLSGTVTVNANNTWSSSIDARTIVNGVTTNQALPASGTWVQNGSTITFTDTFNGPVDFTAVVATDMLTAQIDFEAPVGVVVLVFTK